MDIPIATFPSAYEWSIDSLDYCPFVNAEIKALAFQRMKNLEGWCTPFKASILMDLIFVTNPETVVEIGVFGGKSLIPMATMLQGLGKGKIYGIDPWSASASIEGMDGVNLDWWDAIDYELILGELINKIAEFNLENQIILLRTTSEEAAPISPIDLLHIDGNHSEVRALADAQKWVPLVRKGGIIIFDDINWPSTAKAVEWLNEQCLFIQRYDESSSWGIWIKR